MLYLIGGENLYLSTQRLEELKEEFHQRFKGTVKTYNADEVDNYDKILTNADSLPLFHKKKLIVLKRLFSANKSFIIKVCEFVKESKDIKKLLTVS